MNTIYKYKLKVADVQIISLPLNYNIISLQVQKGVPCIWVAVDTEATENIDTIILTRGTGESFNGDGEVYIDSYQLDDGNLVFHVFAKA